MKARQPLSKQARQEFVDSNFLRVELISVEKKWVHHNRFILQVTTDKQNIRLKKKYSQIRRFSQQVQKNLQLKDFALESQLIRSAEQYKAIQTLMKKLDGYYLQKYIGMSQSQRQLSSKIRNYLFNMLFYNQQINSDNEDNEETISSPNKSLTGSMVSSIVKSNSNQVKVDKTLKGKSMAIAATLVSNVINVMGKGESQPFKQIFNTINILWMKVDNQWHECRLSINDTTLILHDRFLNNKKIIVMCKMEVVLYPQPYHRVILSHQLLKTPIQFRLTNITDTSKDYDLNDKYLALYTYLKEISSKLKMIETFNFVKINLGITEQKMKVKQLGFKIIHNTILTSFTLYSDCTCDIIMPIVSNFGIIEMFITEAKESGVIPSFKEHLYNFSIPVQNVYDLLYNEKPKRRTEIRSVKFQTKQAAYNMNLKYTELSTYQAYYAYDVRNDRFQGNMQFEQLNRDQVRIQFNRLKRMLWSLQLYTAILSDLQNFTNPKTSYFFYLVITLMILFSDMEYLLHYIIGSLLVIMTYTHPSLRSFIKQIVEYTSCQKQLKKIQDIINLKKNDNQYEINFKFDLEKKRFLQNFELTMKKKRNIYKKYKRLQQIMVKSQNSLMDFMNFLQKVKNLFTWYHHKKSYLLYSVLLGILVIIIFIPIRVILLIALYLRFKKGKTYHEKTFAHNKLLISQIYSLTIATNKMPQMEQYIKTDDKLLVKTKSQYINFQKKVKQNIEQLLQIQIPPQIFEHSKTINQSKTLFAKCRKRYSISLANCRKYQLSERWTWKDSGLSKIIKIVIGFISNIPSDRNILGVKAESENLSAEKMIDQIEDIREDGQDDQDNRLFGN